MIKILLYSLFAFSLALSAQSPQDIMDLINKKDYNQAYAKSKKLIYKNDNKDKFLYTNILAIAGRHFTGELTEEKIENFNIEYQDMNIRLSDYPVSSGNCHTNCFRFLKEEPPELFLVKTFLDSKDKPAIVLMVYIDLKNPISKDKFDKMNNEKATLKGKVKNLELSGNMYKRLNLRIYNAELSLNGN